jgi:hypothetical protein
MSNGHETALPVSTQILLIRPSGGLAVLVSLVSAYTLGMNSTTSGWSERVS